MLINFEPIGTCLSSLWNKVTETCSSLSLKCAAQVVALCLWIQDFIVHGFLGLRLLVQRLSRLICSCTDV